MVDFDPINLGDYRPFLASTLKEVAYYIARMRAKARWLSWELISKIDIYTEEEKKEISDLIDWDKQNEIYIPQSIWSYMRTCLAENLISAFCVNDNGERVPIDASFWANDVALQAMSTGSINIPMYPPRGTIYISSDDKEIVETDSFHLCVRVFSDDNFFKQVSVEKYKSDALRLRSKGSGSLDRGSAECLIDYDNNTFEKIKLPRGRRRSFNAEIYLIELIRIIIRDRPDMGEYGMKKKIRTQVREAYERNGDGGDLPDDDTLSRYMADVLRDCPEQERRSIPHKPG